MKRKIICLVSILLLTALVSFSSYAENITLDTMLRKLGDRNVTSLKKVELIDSYKGQVVKGAGKVRDVVKSFGSENTALVYIRKPYQGKLYEIILTVDQQSAENIKKGRNIAFEGKFAGMTFETLRLEEGKITGSGGMGWFGWWPF